MSRAISSLSWRLACARPRGDVRVAILESHADCRDLVDDEDPLAVGHHHLFFRIRVVRRPIGVGADPLEQGVVLDEQRHVEAATAGEEVLVPAEAFQIDRLAVEQQPLGRGLHRADADGQRVDVRDLAVGIDQRDGGLVQVGVLGRPEARIGDRDLGSRAIPLEAGPRLMNAAIPTQTDRHRAARAVLRHAELDDPRRPVDLGRDGDVGDVRLRDGEEPHRPVQPGIGEEIVGGAGIAGHQRHRAAAPGRHIAGGHARGLRASFSTRIASVFGPSHATVSVMSHSKGRWPPECPPTFCPLTHISAA